jgi:malonyl CoA-acyl carrier protein transacylase
MISTSDGLIFATLKAIMRGNNFTLELDEEEKYFEGESITATTEIQPGVFAVAVAGYNQLQILDRNK